MPLELLLRTAKELVAAWDNSGPDSVATRAALNRLGAAAYNSVDALGSLSAERDALAARVAQADAVAAEIREDSPASYMQEWADRLSPPTASPAPVSEPQPATEPAQVEVVGYVPASEINHAGDKHPLPKTLWPTDSKLHEPVALVRLSTLESVRAENDQFREALEIAAGRSYREKQNLIERAESAERERDAYRAVIAGFSDENTAAGEVYENIASSIGKWITNRVAELMGDTK